MVKSAQLSLVMPKAARRLLLNILENLCADASVEPWSLQNAIDQCTGESVVLVFGFKNGPGRASGQAKCVRLFIERAKSRRYEGVRHFFDFCALSILHVVRFGKPHTLSLSGRRNTLFCLHLCRLIRHL